ncbi:hypothetical protein [Hymenobacter negativus]|uniref:DUF1834 family protein n=1 Tax=Hymenobacter negativus TaxID=2795026 RepID=A0ABS3QIM4_9BACT|nr:hypothetical protein [Hymenobacter negativus]MBO2010878.1 hypothetical protein [Hymenobacter negativus]
MTYKQVVDYLKQQATAVGAGSFWHGKETAKDINYDAAFPQVYLFLVPSTIRDGRVISKVRMCFFGNDEQGSSSDEALLIQDAMDVLTQQFVAALDEDGQGALGDVDRGPVTRSGSTIGTGFFLSFTFSTPALC